MTNYEKYVECYYNKETKVCADIVYQCIVEQERANNMQPTVLDVLRLKALEDYIETLYNASPAVPTKEEFFQILSYISQQLIDKKIFPNNN